MSEKRPIKRIPREVVQARKENVNTDNDVRRLAISLRKAIEKTTPEDAKRMFEKMLDSLM